jgi:hypothetical protein
MFACFVLAGLAVVSAGAVGVLDATADLVAEPTLPEC